MCFRMINLDDRRACRLVGGVQYKDGLAREEFHPIKLDHFRQYAGRTYEQPVHIGDFIVKPRMNYFCRMPDSFATVKSAKMKMMVKTSHAPLPMGPYSQAIVAGNLIFVSALLGEDPATGELSMDTIEAETTRVMDNIKAILAEAGVDFTNVVKCSIFLKDMGDYAKVNKVYSSYLSEPFPARETIQVAGLPKNVNIEISAIAVKS